MANVLSCTKCQEEKKEIKQTKFSNLQIILLNLIYQDLANRCKNSILARQTFDQFFNLSGLWGQEMFNKFDTKKDGIINFDEFIQGIEVMVKGSFQQKAEVLFTFYDSNKTDGISYRELLKMLYSYPKQQLNQMVNQQKFIKSIQSHHLSFYFGPERNLLNQIEIIDQDTDYDSGLKYAQNSQPYPSYYPPSLIIKKPQLDSLINQLQNNDSDCKKNNIPQILKNKKSKKKQLSRKKIGIHSLADVIIGKNLQKRFHLTSNIASIVKRYAIFLFNEFKIDKNKDQIKREQFFQLIKNHQRIFSTFFQVFHSYAWMVDDDGIPLNNKMTPWIEGSCKQCYGQQIQNRYLVYIKNTIFVYNRKRTNQPISIINLQGLNALQVKNNTSYGFKFKHRDGLYHEKQYLFKNKEDQQQWMKHLFQFRQNDIFERFKSQQRIGTGNFSVVYRGQDLQQHQKVAIKVIEKFKLSYNEQQVIKFQCGILQLCHHPNIVKFIKKYDTKTHIYIITEYFSQGDLFQHTHRSSFLQEFEAVIIFKQIVQGIRYLNDLGIIHRDLKPENIMIVTNQKSGIVQKVKIIDFGFAVYKNNLKNLSQKQKFAGTPGFVAPQILNGQDYDESVDTFSLGIILYFMLSGSLPFYSNFCEEIIEQTKNCTVVLCNNHWSNISPSAKDLLNSILTYKEERISLAKIILHPYLNNVQQLKQYIGRNKKNRYIN